MAIFNSYSNFRPAVKKSRDPALFDAVQCRENKVFSMEGCKQKTEV